MHIFSVHVSIIRVCAWRERRPVKREFRVKEAAAKNLYYRIVYCCVCRVCLYEYFYDLIMQTCVAEAAVEYMWMRYSLLVCRTIYRINDQ